MRQSNNPGSKAVRADVRQLMEDAALDAALDRPDDLLVQSLRREQRGRRLRWIGGALVMTLLLGAAAFLLITPKNGVAADASELTQQGWQLWQQRKLTEAETAFTQATELNPKLDSAWNGLGWARLNAGKTDEAVLAFQKCVELIPAHAAALNGLGQAFLSQRKYVEAEEHLKDAAEGGASAAWYGLMRIYMLQGKYEDARVWAEKVAAANPQDPICQQVLAAAQAGELPSDLRQLIEPPEPMSADTQNAWQLFNSGRMTEAREVFKQALTADPDDISAHNGLGFVLLNTGDHADARPHFKACLESQPQHWGAMNGLARCLKAEGDIDGAVKLWQQMVDGVPGINAGHAGLADVYFERREYDKAVQFYEQLAAASAGDSFYAARLKTAREELEKSKSSN